jgi:hypothetical protein
MGRIFSVVMSVVILLQVAYGQQISYALNTVHNLKIESSTNCCSEERESCCEETAPSNSSHEKTSTACCGKDSKDCQHPCCKAPVQLQTQLLFLNYYHEINFSTSGITGDSWHPPRHI